MSATSTNNRYIACAIEQGASSPVLSQAGVVKNATGCGKLSLPSKDLNRLNKTPKLNKKNNPIKTVINKQQFSIGTINLQTGKDELQLAEYTLNVKNNKNDICLFQETRKTGSDELTFEDPVLGLESYLRKKHRPE